MKPYETKTEVNAQHNTFQGKLRIKTLVKYFHGKLFGEVLYVGRSDQLAQTLLDNNDIKMCHTNDDLDTSGSKREPRFDIIIMSHVIEHLFNPLFCLHQLKKELKNSGIIYIILPQRPKFLWTDNHFHEIDDKRMRCLLDRAGLEILEKSRQTHRKEWFTMFFGIRPFLRLLIGRKATIYKLRRSK